MGLGFLSFELHSAQWLKIAKNGVVSTRLLACLFARLLAPLTHSLVPHCSLRSRAPLRTFTHSLAC